MTQKNRPASESALGGIRERANAMVMSSLNRNKVGGRGFCGAFNKPGRPF